MEALNRVLTPTSELFIGGLVDELSAEVVGEPGMLDLLSQSDRGFLEIATEARLAATSNGGVAEQKGDDTAQSDDGQQSVISSASTEPVVTEVPRNNGLILAAAHVAAAGNTPLVLSSASVRAIDRELGSLELGTPSSDHQGGLHHSSPGGIPVPAAPRTSNAVGILHQIDTVQTTASNFTSVGAGSILPPNAVRVNGDSNQGDSVVHTHPDEVAGSILPRTQDAGSILPRTLACSTAREKIHRHSVSFRLLLLWRWTT